MKTLLIYLLFTISFTAYSSSEVKEGIIRQVSCNRPSGLGLIDLEYKSSKKTLVIETLMVNSMTLCGASPGEETQLGAIGFEALMLDDPKWFHVQVDDGFVVYVEEQKDIVYHDYVSKVKNFQLKGQRTAYHWFHRYVQQIDFTVLSEVENMRKRFTSNDFLQGLR